MKHTLALIMTMFTVAAVIGMVTVNIQQVSAPRDCGACTEFKKLTHEYEKNVINTIGETNTGPQPHLRELLQGYVGDVNTIFIGDPNIDRLLQTYEQDVTTIFDVQPPDPDKQIKDFRGLTHDFEKAVIGAVSPPDPDTPA
jgi:hypothetical protein